MLTVAALAVINEICGKEDPARREKVISAAQAAFARVTFLDGFVFKLQAGDSDVFALFTRHATSGDMHTSATNSADNYLMKLLHTEVEEEVFGTAGPIPPIRGYATSFTYDDLEGLKRWYVSKLNTVVPMGKSIW